MTPIWPASWKPPMRWISIWSARCRSKLSMSFRMLVEMLREQGDGFPGKQFVATAREFYAVHKK